MMQETGADIIGRALAEAGATHAFGIPGGEVLGLMDGLARAGLSFVLVKHENAGGFMAEGLWHATGAPGVLVATIGPGVANAINVVANAWQDRVPLIFLTGCVDAALAETYTHQVFDHQALLRPIVKGSFRAAPGAVGAMMAKAVALALDGQPGPVHIAVPIAIAEGPSEERRVPPIPAAGATRPAADAVLARCRAQLAGAARPLVIAGVDAVNAEAGPALSAFCRAEGLPLITSYKGKGLLDERDPLALGGAGLSPKADAILMPLIRAADCILLAGYDPIEMRTGWIDPWTPGTPVIDITPVLRTHGMHSVTETLRADLAPTLAALASGTDTPPRWTGGEIAAAQTALADAFQPPDWGPGAVFSTLRAVLPAEPVITADSGAHRILLSQTWPCPGPRQMLQSTALCTMACAVPLAAGHALGAPGTPVVAFVGDAGLEMGLGELATLRDMGVTLIVCVLVDTLLALIEMKQRNSQRPNQGVDFGATDFPAVAAALGLAGQWIDDTETLAKAAPDALARGGVTVLACRIDRRAYDGTF